MSELVSALRPTTVAEWLTLIGLALMLIGFTLFAISDLV